MNSDEFGELADLGVATVYEASGRQGLIDVPLVQVIPDSKVAGPARTVLCGQDDNLMVHAIMEDIQPGEVVVFSMPEPAPVALIGDLLATQAAVRSAAALLVDASVRDLDELQELGLPIWARWVRAHGATKTTVGKLNEPVEVGGAVITNGDTVVLDIDGAVAVEASRTKEVLEAARERADREAKFRKKLEAGDLSYDLHGLRELVEGKDLDR